MGKIKILDESWLNSMAFLSQSVFMELEASKYDESREDDIKNFLYKHTEMKLLENMNAGNIFWGYIDHKKLVGYLRYNKTKNLLSSFFVAKEYRNSGVVEMLIQTAIDYCTKQRIKKLYAGAFTYLIPMYQKCGFMALGGVSYTSDGIEYVPMERYLI